jgi:hypothetical protein
MKKKTFAMRLFILAPEFLLMFVLLLTPLPLSGQLSPSEYSTKQGNLLAGPRPPAPPLPAPNIVIAARNIGYLGTGPGGYGCMAEIIYYIQAPSLMMSLEGEFHVGNGWYGPDGDVYPTTTLSVNKTGSYWVHLGGQQPEYYLHRVWLVTHDRRVSNSLWLACKGTGYWT